MSELSYALYIILLSWGGRVCELQPLPGVFRALANATRFSIVRLLRSGPHHVGQIGEKLGFEQSRVSHNLACLLNCGFVLAEWQGKNKVYRLSPDMRQILAGIEKHLVRYAPALDRCEVLQAEAGPLVGTRATRSRKTHPPPPRPKLKKGKLIWQPK